MLDDLIAARLIALNDALARTGFTYAFGGAIALGYCIREPRGTTDIDVNVFVPAEAAADVLAALPSGIGRTATDEAQLVRDGQVRLRWGETPIDIFLSTDAFHDSAAAAVRVVPFGKGIDIPVLSCAHLAVFKTFFARPKDFLDISNMVEARTFDVAKVRATIAGLLGDSAEELAPFDAAVVYGRSLSSDTDRDEPKNRFPRR